MDGITNEALKEYYIRLQQLQENCTNILQAINQSMTSSSSEITVDITNSNGSTSRLRIPSFIYLESKLAQLESNFNSLYEMPKSGEAWMAKSSDMFKLKMVRASTAPITPVISNSTPYAGSEASILLKDLVSPHTYLRLKVTNLPENVDKMVMRKLVINSGTLYDSLQEAGISTYDEYRAALFNYTKGIDFEEYDEAISLPVRHDTYDSSFGIVEIPHQMGDVNIANPWYDNGKLCYRVRLSTVTYTDSEDTSMTFTLKTGDKVCLANELAIYTVMNVDPATATVILREEVGHIALQPHDINDSMTLKIYNDNYSLYNYVDVPLEENRFVVIFLAVMTNNTRSSFSDAYPVDLSKIYMKDESGNIMVDSHGNQVSYMSYYEQYCTNIGDLILGITETSYPQLSNYTGNILNELQTSPSIKTLVSSSIGKDGILQVVPINKHIVDDTTDSEIMSLHSQKNDIQASLTTVQDNISQIYNTLTNTDFSQETANTIEALQGKLSSYYVERTTLQTQLNAIIDNINARAKDSSVTLAKTKYRVRGLADIESLEGYIHDIAGDNASVMAMEVQYKYKSVNKDTDTLTVINSTTFTDWNKLQTIDRDRELVIDKTMSSWTLRFVDYKSTDNIIKWNQVDIPIQAGEDVVLRVRYKYCIGQPYVNLYTPWSDEVTIAFPQEYTMTPEMRSIIETNENDTVLAGFRRILISDGYEEHINNKLVASDAVFFHMPENIYSGFNTSENNLISLKDKLLQMSQDIEFYKSLVDGEVNSKYDVYIQYDGQLVPLTPNSINHINIYNTDHVTGTFIKKDMNIIIKNSGNTRVNFYSIFPGNTSVSLLKSDIDSYHDIVSAYERVPLVINNQIALQMLGQWVYFRQTNPYTKEDIYYDIQAQRRSDVEAASAQEPPYDILWNALPSDYMMKDNAQCLHVYRDRTGLLSNSSASSSIVADTLTSIIDYIDSSKTASEEEMAEKRDAINSSIDEIRNYNEELAKAYDKWTDDDFIYYNSIWSTKEGNIVRGKENKFLMRYEDIQGTNQSTQKTVFLDDKISISNFLANYVPLGFSDTSDFCGAFIYPDILSREQIMTEGQSNDKVFIDEGEQLVIPVVFEYYLDGKVDEDSGINNTEITKSLYFDLKSSLIKNPVHYMIEMTGHYDMTSTGDVYSNFSMVDLEDNVTNN